MTNIRAPLSIEAGKAPRAGESVRITGTVYTMRDAAHKVLCELLERGEKPPFVLLDAVIYYAGPTPPPPGHVLGSCGPTTASRMDKYTPYLLEKGLRGMIGKGHRSQTVVASCKQFSGVYFAAEGGCGALLSRCIKASEVIAFPELGTEAIRKLWVEGFPAQVAVDTYGEVFDRWTF